MISIFEFSEIENLKESNLFRIIINANYVCGNLFCIIIFVCTRKK